MDYGSGGQADTATAISAAEEKTRPECRSSAYVVSPTGHLVSLSATSHNDGSNALVRRKPKVSGGVRITSASSTTTLVRRSQDQGTIDVGRNDSPSKGGGTGGEHIPPRFKKVLDEATGRHYYYDKETRKTFWTLAEISAGVPETSARCNPQDRRKTYGYPPSDVGAVSQNQAALVWWKALPQGNDPQEEQCLSGNDMNSVGQLREGQGADVKVTGAPGGGGCGDASSLSRAERKGHGEDRVANTREGRGSISGRGSIARGPKAMGYVVARYRLDAREWHKKGVTYVDGADAASARVKGLHNGLVYRFTVASRTAEGDSAESDPSAAVRPNQPLPQGWTEKFTAMTGKSVYKNIKTGQASTERPEVNPYFVETELFLKFSPEEAESLSKEFRVKAETENSDLVSVSDILELLPRLGEPLREAEIVKRLEREGWGGTADGRDTPNVSYPQFLAFLWGIKGPKVTRRSIGNRVWSAVMARLAPRNVSAKKLALIEQDAGKRLGAWKKLVHPVAGRPYFVNDDTGQTCWTTPAEVKFFLNDKLREDLLKTTFSEQELTDLRNAFDRMDLDSNGSIDADELGLILKSFGEAVPASRVKALMREVDHDGSGEMDFEEFAVMMQAVKKGKASLGWGRINRHLEGDGRKFDGLAEQFKSFKTRQRANTLGTLINHEKFCLCGCRATKATEGDRHKVIYKDWGTTKTLQHPQGGTHKDR